MIVGSLFAGIGGFDEGLRQAGMESSWQVEKEPFCLKVLKTRFPNAQRAADILTCRGLTSSVPASHARIGRSRERERDCQAHVARSFISLQESCTSFDPLGSSSRMFPDFSVVTTDETLRKSSGFSWSSAGMGFNGVCLTASFSESPSAAAVCSLSDVLESHAPQRFFLSQKAAQGILRRAEKRGRVLPTRLAEALSVLATGTTRTAKNSSPSHSALESLATRRGEEEKTLDCSMLAKGQMMPEKRRFACVLTPEESDRGTIQPTASRTCANNTPSQPHSTQAETTADSEPSRENILSVRRLTPTECEVLQGFPKGWTLPDTALLETPSPSTSFAGSDEELCGTKFSGETVT